MDALYLTVVSALVVHELDAIRNREWRFFFAPLPVDEETAYRAFVALHAPALVAVLWSLESATVQLGLDAFAVVHGGAHLLVRNHPRVEFDDRFSWLWIAGAALLAGLHLLRML